MCWGSSQRLPPCTSTLKHICWLAGQLLRAATIWHEDFLNHGWKMNFKMKELMMEPDAEVGIYGLGVHQRKEYIRHRESYAPPRSLVLTHISCWFASEDLALFSGLHLSVWPFQTKKAFSKQRHMLRWSPLHRHHSGTHNTFIGLLWRLKSHCEKLWLHFSQRASKDPVRAKVCLKDHFVYFRLTQQHDDHDLGHSGDTTPPASREEKRRLDLERQPEGTRPAADVKGNTCSAHVHTRNTLTERCHLAVVMSSAEFLPITVFGETNLLDVQSVLLVCPHWR